MMEPRSAWIAMRGDGVPRGAPLFRRAFALDAPVASAALHICGLGYYEAWLNGRRVGDHVLDPAQTDYGRRVFTVTYDVADLLRTGGNALGVMLGNGWYHQDRVWGPHGLSYGRPRLLLALQVALADGRSVLVPSDGSWKCAPGPVTGNNIYAGESYDARRERPGWDRPGFDDAAWAPVAIVPGPGGRLEPQGLPPIRRIEELRPVAIRPAGQGRHLVDLGQNFAGWARLRVQAEAGTEIRLRFAETVDEDGRLDTASTGVFATGVEQVDRYTCRGGGVEEWEPRFTYHGFRYVEVDGWPGEPAPEDITGVVVHTDLPAVGHFECSDERLNRLHRMARWTLRSNLHGLPEDCPARERCGWLGDANMTAEALMWNFDAKAFWEKFLGDIETTRAANHGIPCNIAPGKRGTGGNANPDWAAAFILIPWTVYVRYGDASVLARHWEGMTRLMRHYREQADGWILEGGYGDWFDPGGESICTHTPPTLTTTLWFCRCAAVMRDAAAALGRPAEQARYADWAQRIRDAFIARYYARDTGTFGSQTADAMALQFGAVPDGEELRVVAALVGDIRRRDTHLNTGIMGVRYLFEVLSRRGHGETALALMHQDSYPGFGDLIRRGATTLWESWGEQAHEGTHGPRSLNHPMMGGFDNWFFNTLAGIRPDPEAPGFRHFFLAPRPIRGLEWVRAHYESPRGRIVSEWQVADGVLSWTVAVPPGTQATATLPFTGEVLRLGPGRHPLSVRERAEPSP